MTEDLKKSDSQLSSIIPSTACKCSTNQLKREVFISVVHDATTIDYKTSIPPYEAYNDKALAGCPRLMKCVAGSL
jgi:hypothetical protein